MTQDHVESVVPQCCNFGHLHLHHLSEGISLVELTFLLLGYTYDTDTMVPIATILLNSTNGVFKTTLKLPGVAKECFNLWPLVVCFMVVLRKIL